MYLSQLSPRQKVFKSTLVKFHVLIIQFLLNLTILESYTQTQISVLPENTNMHMPSLLLLYIYTHINTRHVA